jgi:hypothetical protein
MGLLVLLVVVVVCLTPVNASTESVVTLNDLTIAIHGVAVALTDELFSGKSRALLIILTPERLTDQEGLELLRGENWRHRAGRHAILVLFIDKDERIWQVNLTVVIPGQTVIRTVAWKSEDLERFTAGYAYDGKRLKLTAQGQFADPSSEPRSFRLGWDVDLDAPVVNRLGAGRKLNNR